MRKSKNSQTDWKKIRQNIATNAAIPYSPQDGPYDPNDEKATAEYLSTTIVRRPRQCGA